MAACWAWAAGNGAVDKTAPTSAAVARVAATLILRMNTAVLAWWRSPTQILRAFRFSALRVRESFISLR
jgi:hypothetical protein